MVRLAIIGAGPFARDAHAPAVRSMPELFQVVAVYNRSAGPAEALAGDFEKAGFLKPDVYSGGGEAVGELLARADVDAVSIVLDANVQPEFVRAALKAGKHVMSEKPIAGTIAEGAALADEYAREYAPRGLLWGILETYRFEAGLIRAAELTGDPSRVGSLMMVEGRFHTPIPPESRFASPQRLNLLIEGGCHFTAAIRMLVEGGRGVGSVPVTATTGISSGCSPTLQHPNTLTASYAFAGGPTAALTVSYGAPSRVSVLHATGSRGVVSIERGVSGGAHGYRVTCETVSDGRVPVPPGVDEFHPFAGVAAAVRAFGEAAATRAELDARLSPSAALEDVRMIEDAIRPVE